MTSSLSNLNGIDAAGATGSVTVTGLKTGSSTLIGGDGASAITGYGHDTIVAGAGLTTITTGSGGSSILLSTAAATVAVNGSNNVITAVKGSTLTLTGTGDTVIGSGVTVALTTGASSLTINGDNDVIEAVVGDQITIVGSNDLVNWIHNDGTATSPTPSISNIVSNQAVTDLTTIKPFSTVVIADTDAGQTETVTVTLSASANGKLTNLGNGNYNAATGIFTDTGSTTAITADLNGLVFNPLPHQVAPGQTVTTVFTISATDSAAAHAANSATSVIATTGTVLPTISGAVAAQAVTASGTITPFSAVTVGDLNFGQTETLTVSLSAPANGTLTNLSGGTYSAGTYTVTGTAATVTNALRGLVFTPHAAAGRPRPDGHHQLHNQRRR